MMRTVSASAVTDPASPWRLEDNAVTDNVPGPSGRVRGRGAGG
jgi:hypothetical protein